MTRNDKRLDHLGVDEVPVELVDLVQPEVVRRLDNYLRVRNRHDAAGLRSADQSEGYPALDQP